LTPLFPSYALIAFAGAIEQVGSAGAFRDLLGDLPSPCPACGNVPGATARFKNTIKLVLSNKETNELLKRWDPYSARSKTAYQLLAQFELNSNGLNWSRYNQNLWMHHLTEGATYLPL
jgi:hypothetical protein